MIWDENQNQKKKKMKNEKLDKTDTTNDTKRKSVKNECNHTGKKLYGRCKLCWQNEFIQKSIKIHNDVYGYDSVEYTDSQMKVKIFCKKCNQFFKQSPNAHLSGKGCNKCGNNTLKSLNEFIKQCNHVHGENEFDYSSVIYLKNDIKVNIKCNRCNNIFSQTPTAHLKCKKCPVCKKLNKNSEMSNNPRKITEKKFLNRVKKLYGNKFVFLEKYIDYNAEIKIRCNDCGNIFIKSPTQLINGGNCKPCHFNKLSNLFKKSKDIFVNQAMGIHGKNRYDYSLFEYKNSKTKSKIKCNKCNLVFYQAAEKHLSGRGCSYCKNSLGETKIRVFLENNNIYYTTQKTYDDLVGTGGGKLKFDFYIPTKNLLIEFDGQQHFTQGFFKGIKITKCEFEKLKKHDIIKNEYAKKYGVDLLRISYFDKDKIPEILTEKLL